MAWDDYMVHKLASPKLWNVFEPMDKIEKYGSDALSALTVRLRHQWETYEIYSQSRSREELAPGSPAIREAIGPLLELIEIYSEWKAAARAEIGVIK